MPDRSQYGRHSHLDARTGCAGTVLLHRTAERQYSRAALSELPVRAFVGSEDTIVSPRQSIAFIRALQKINPNAQITVIPGADHFAVPDAYTDEKHDILGWMLSQS